MKYEDFVDKPTVVMKKVCKLLALDFYAGFYMKGNKDGRLCEDRDEIHARTGARCEVDKFKRMVAVPRDDD